MKSHRYSTVTDQVTDTLREGMAGGRWRGTLPGRERLARELGVNHKTVETAVQRLVAEGWLVGQGGRRRRSIVLPEETVKPRLLRVRILLFDQADAAVPWSHALIGQLHRAGFAANFAIKSLMDLGMNVERVARFVEKTEADAWIVCAGSHEVLQWFSRQKIPAIAMFGRFTGVNIAAASPRITLAMQTAVRRLVELGHRRIVMLAGTSRRKPFPGIFERKFLLQLKALGLPVGIYNLPDWDYHADGLRDCLDGLFSTTPPTALIMGETRFFEAAQQHLARRGIHAPEDVSLINSDPAPSFEWCKPAISHFEWHHEPVVRRVVRWVKNVSMGKEDLRQTLSKGFFVEGETIGPVS